MKLLFVCLMTCAAGAAGAYGTDRVNDAIFAAPAPAPAAEPDVKALQGQVDPALRKAVADALKVEAEAGLPRASSQLGTVAYGSVNSTIMTNAFNEAKVPDCLHSEGLKRQPTFLLTGYLALPFIAVAKLRGKCI